MRWLPFLILAYVVLGLQAGIGPFVRVQGATLDLALIAAVFVAANAPREPALLGAFFIGLSKDVLSMEPLGLYALSYGLVGLIVVSARQVAYGDHPLTHFVLTLGGGLLTAIILYIHGRLRPIAPAPAPDGQPLPAVAVSLGLLLLTVLYTAVVAPFVLWLLSRFKPWFGFRASRARW
jgi:rod shape-determining protein MreD